MAGMFVGTKLDQLMYLRRKVDEQIRLEKRRLVLEGRMRRQATKAAKAAKAAAPAPEAVQARLERLGVDSIHVKRWAKATGLITEIKRGRVHPDLVNAYEKAHKPDGGPVGPAETTNGDAVTPPTQDRGRSVSVGLTGLPEGAS